MMSRNRVLLFSLLLTLGSPAAAQIGGTGADGALAPTTNLVLDTAGRSGGFDFTSIDIPSGITVRLKGPNPAILRSQTTVRIAGHLNADGFRASGPSAGVGGPAGFDGGQPGMAGAGPAGGAAGTGDVHIRNPAGNGGHATPGVVQFGPTSPTYGSARPFDLRGGSGGGGFLNPVLQQSFGGGGGGGVVVLLADGAIEVSGAVTADGAGRGDTGTGAGGAVFIRSATDVTIAGRVSADGPGVFLSPLFAFGGGDGFVRIESWGEPPRLEATADVVPAALVASLPHLESTLADLGSLWVHKVGCLASDRAEVLFSPGTFSFSLGTLGVLGLDPTVGIIPIGRAIASPSGIEPEATIVLRIPPDPSLQGVGANTQAFVLATSTPEGPRLSNTVPGVFR